MKTLYIECKMGAAGDMLMSALFELLDADSQNKFISTMNSIFNEDVNITAEKSSKCNITGTHMHVKVLGQEESFDIHENHHEHDHHHNHEHHTHNHKHYSYQNVCDIINNLNIPESVISNSLQVYKSIGEAEAFVHNSTLENIHFHEVGSLDAMCDVVGCALLFDMIKADRIIVSPIHVGNGIVKCAHGILPVPAPATAEILKGIPFYTGNINSELCTPTGAAILKNFATKFDSMPPIQISKTGIGLGTKDFEVANCVRVFLGETMEDLSDSIIELSCNLDDMTGEELGFAMDILLENGALDVFFTNIQMKKNRPGILLSCFCNHNEIEKFQNLIFKYTTTRGIRFRPYDRVKLSASFEEVETSLGTVHRKTNTGYGIEKSKFEFEDIKKIAIDNNMSLFDVKK